MFSAVDARIQQRVILLDAVDEIAKDAFRQAARDGHLHCPICNQPVIVRLGVERRPHFAHKHLSNCPSSHESPELLRARDVLYRWLKTKFESGVTVEKQLEQHTLPRWIDCWVETPKGQKFAYWIIEKAIKPSDREALFNLLRDESLSVNFVFLSQMMTRNEAPEGVLNLTTTERELKAASEYNLIYVSGGNYRSTGTLHYLDAERETVITFRAMRCTEPLQQYTGKELSSRLADLKVSPVNGEMVHAIEADALRRRKEEIQAKAEAERRQMEEAAAKAKLDADKWASILQSATSPSSTDTSQSVDVPVRSFYDGGKKEGVCVFCGTRTRNWWRRDGASGRCQCWQCRHVGRFNEGSDW